jgi:hypothetical protein
MVCLLSNKTGFPSTCLQISEGKAKLCYSPKVPGGGGGHWKMVFSTLRYIGNGKLFFLSLSTFSTAYIQVTASRDHLVLSCPCVFTYICGKKYISVEKKDISFCSQLYCRAFILVLSILKNNFICSQRCGSGRFFPDPDMTIQIGYSSDPDPST